MELSKGENGQKIAHFEEVINDGTPTAAEENLCEPLPPLEQFEEVNDAVLDSSEKKSRERGSSPSSKREEIQSPEQSYTTGSFMC